MSAAGRSISSRFVAGRRKAEQDRKAPIERAQWAEVTRDQHEVRSLDDNRLRMMARIEPARYLKLVALGSVKGTHVKEARGRLR